MVQLRVTGSCIHPVQYTFVTIQLLAHCVCLAIPVTVLMCTYDLFAVAVLCVLTETFLTRIPGLHGKDPAQVGKTHVRNDDKCQGRQEARRCQKNIDTT